MKIIFHGLLVIVFASLSMFGLPASAQTPDGETPANEGVCDGLFGLTPGLYGLCVAFCEAQDAEATFVDPATGEVTFAAGSKPSNPKLLEIYDKKKAVDDPPMPCVNVVANECPCWTEAELDEVGGNTDLPGDMWAQTQSPFEQIVLVGADVVTNLPELAVVDVGNLQFCLLDHIVDNSSGIPQTQTRSMNIDALQRDTCRQSLVAECASRGLPVQ